MIDKFKAWLNVNISVFDEQNRDRSRSLLQRRKARYKRDILKKALDVYKEVNE